jgi:hypothetical protein
VSVESDMPSESSDSIAYHRAALQKTNLLLDSSPLDRGLWLAKAWHFHRCMVDTLGSQERLERTLRFLQHADAHNWRTVDFRARVLRELGRSEQAYRELRNLRLSGDETPELLLELAKSAYLSGRFREAWDYVEEADRHHLPVPQQLRSTIYSSKENRPFEDSALARLVDSPASLIDLAKSGRGVVIVELNDAKLGPLQVEVTLLGAPAAAVRKFTLRTWFGVVLQ